MVKTTLKIERSGDLIFWTYFMIDWKKAKQYPSEKKCQQCGAEMKRVESVTDSKGTAYDGYVCHHDKVLIWVRAG